MMRLTIDYVWSQKQIPAIWRGTETGEKNRVKLPYALGNRAFLSALGKIKPIWDGTEWIIPKTWFNKFVDAALKRYGKVYIIQPYNEMEVCAPACLNATRHECECSCMGKNHGAGGNGSWFEISDAFAIRWSGRYLACRLLTAKS